MSTPELLAAPDPATVEWVPLGSGASVQATVPSCRVYNSASVPIANAALGYLPFDSERWDTDNIHDAVNPSRLTCRTAGKYLIVGHTRWQGILANAIYITSISFNHTKEIARQSITVGSAVAAAPESSVAVIWDMAVGDYVELSVYQNSGGNLNVERVDGWSPEFEMVYLGPGLLSTILAPTITYSATPPASPSNGDLWVLPADATNGVMWQFRYNASSASAYKWEFVGGQPFMIALNNSTPTSTVGAWWNPVTGLQCNVPRSGDYISRCVTFYNCAAALNIFCGLTVGNTTPTFQYVVSSTAAGYATGVAEARHTGVASGAAIQPLYNQANGTAGQVALANPVLTVTPVRVS